MHAEDVSEEHVAFVQQRLHQPRVLARKLLLCVCMFVGERGREGGREGAGERERERERERESARAERERGTVVSVKTSWCGVSDPPRESENELFKERVRGNYVFREFRELSLSTLITWEMYTIFVSKKSL